MGRHGIACGCKAADERLGLVHGLRVARLFDHDDLYTNSPIRKLVGTGLGLGMARQIVQIHGGRLALVRTPALGSEYRFTLPLHWRDRVAAAS